MTERAWLLLVIGLIPPLLLLIPFFAIELNIFLLPVFLAIIFVLLRHKFFLKRKAK